MLFSIGLRLALDFFIAEALFVFLVREALLADALRFALFRALVFAAFLAAVLRFTLDILMLEKSIS